MADERCHPETLHRYFRASCWPYVRFHRCCWLLRKASATPTLTCRPRWEDFDRSGRHYLQYPSIKKSPPSVFLMTCSYLECAVTVWRMFVKPHELRSCLNVWWRVFSGLLMIVLFVSFCTLTFSTDRCMQITGSKVAVSSPLFIWPLNPVPSLLLLSFSSTRTNTCISLWKDVKERVLNGASKVTFVA